MPGADLQQARQALERIINMELGLRPDGRPLTASIGIAERLADNASDCRELLDLADQRMYLAKQSGRNRIIEQLSRAS